MFWRKRRFISVAAIVSKGLLEAMLKADSWYIIIDYKIIELSRSLKFELLSKLKYAEAVIIDLVITESKKKHIIVDHEVTKIFRITRSFKEDGETNVNFDFVDMNGYLKSRIISGNNFGDGFTMAEVLKSWLYFDDKERPIIVPSNIKEVILDELAEAIYMAIPGKEKIEKLLS